MIDYLQTTAPDGIEDWGIMDGPSLNPKFAGSNEQVRMSSCTKWVANNLVIQ